MKNMKKLLPLVLFSLMILPIAASVFAATSDSGQEPVIKNGAAYTDPIRYSGNSGNQNKGEKISANNAVCDITLDGESVGGFVFTKNSQYIEITLTEDVSVDIAWDCGKYYAEVTLSGKGTYLLPQLLQDNGRTQSFNQIWVGSATANEKESLIFNTVRENADFDDVSTSVFDAEKELWTASVTADATATVFDGGNYHVMPEFELGAPLRNPGDILVDVYDKNGLLVATLPYEMSDYGRSLQYAGSDSPIYTNYELMAYDNTSKELYDSFTFVVSYAGVPVLEYTVFVVAESVLKMPNPQSDAIDGVVRTTFQSSGSYRGSIAAAADSVMVYVGNKNDILNQFETWKGKGYIVECMVTVGHDWGRIFTQNGTTNMEYVQLDNGGNPLTLWQEGQILGYYMLPTQEFADYMWELTQFALDNGAEAIVLEEPEFFKSATPLRSQIFKDKWQEYYGEEWTTSSSTFKLETLKVAWMAEYLENMANRIKAYKPSTRVLVASHSTISYNSIGIVGGNSTFYALRPIDGYIAQIWSDTSRGGMRIGGRTETRIFQNSYIEHASMANIKQKDDGKSYFALADPKADDGNWTWHNYEYEYRESIAAQFMMPAVSHFEIMPWPDRAFESAPDDYQTIQLSVFNALKAIYGEECVVEGGTAGVTILMSDSMSWFGNPNSAHSFYGITVPLIEKGIPFNVLPLENITSQSDLANTDLLILSYAFMKPERAAYHDVIAQWVQNGGTLLFLGGYDSYNNMNMWWNDAGYSSPQLDLWAKMGIVATEERIAGNNVALSPATATSLPSLSNINATSNYMVTQTTFGAGGLTGTNLYSASSTDTNVGWECAVGNGWVVAMGLDPYYLANTAAGTDLCRELVCYAAQKSGAYEESNYIKAVRGDFLMYHAFAEPQHVTGKFIDLFSSDLKVLTDFYVSPNNSSFLLDISKKDSSMPEILYTTGNLVGLTYENNRTIYEIKNADRSIGATRLDGAGKRPKFVYAFMPDGSPVNVSHIWDEATKTLLVKHPNSTDGVIVTVGWSDGEAIADVRKNASTTLNIPVDGTYADASFFIFDNSHNGGDFRFCDGAVEIIYKFDLSVYQNATFTFDLANNYTFEASADGINWTMLANSDDIDGFVTDGSNRAYLVATANMVNATDFLYVRIANPNKDMGWGAFVRKFTIDYTGYVRDYSITVSTNDQNLDAAYLIKNTANSHGEARYCDLEGELVYCFDLAQYPGSSFSFDIANNYTFEASADGTNWVMFYNSMEHEGFIDDSVSNRARQVVTADMVNATDFLYVRIANPNKTMGWGAYVRGFSIRYLVPVSSGPDPLIDMRIADYRPNIDGGTTYLTIEITNTTDKYITISPAAASSPAGIAVTTYGNLELAPSQMKLYTIEAKARANTPKGENVIMLEYIIDGATYSNSLPVFVVNSSAYGEEAEITYEATYYNGSWDNAAIIDISKDSDVVGQYGTIWNGDTAINGFFAKYQAKWDESYLYIREVRKSPTRLCLTETGSEGTWAVDASAIFLDLRYTKSGTDFSDGAYTIYYTLTEEGGLRMFLRGDGSNAANIEVSGFVYEVEFDADMTGYTIEIAVPWSVMSVNGTAYVPAGGRLVGFTVLAMKGDGGFTNWNQIMWYGNGDERANWADLVFVR